MPVEVSAKPGIEQALSRRALLTSKENGVRMTGWAPGAIREKYASQRGVRGTPMRRERKSTGSRREDGSKNKIPAVMLWLSPSVPTVLLTRERGSTKGPMEVSVSQRSWSFLWLVDFGSSTRLCLQPLCRDVWCIREGFYLLGEFASILGG